MTQLKDYIKYQHEKKIKKFLKELPFYKAVIGKAYVKRLNKIDMLRQPPFYDELNIVKTSKAFKGYERSYRDKVIDSKDPSVELTICRPSIKDLFQDFFVEIKDFKFQRTLKVILSKYKGNAEREFTSVYFNFTTKTVINHKDNLDKFFQEIFNGIDNWITEWSDCVIESVDGEYVKFIF